MNAVRNWLRDIGMAQYADLFSWHGVELDSIGQLTNDDLRDIGVIRLADRKSLLAEINRLAADEFARDAQRRILSVLFCDLVGSTALSTRLSPEEYRIILQQYLDTCRRAIESHHGYLSMAFGDGVLAYFGWPHAHEDQAALAVRTGLDAVARVRSLDCADGIRIQCRVGISTGRVVIGGGRNPDSAFGDAVNRAARLQGLADPDSVLIDGATARVIGNRFVAQQLDRVAVKGFPHPVERWEVVTERFLRDRFDQRQVPGTTFVGRRSEIDLLNGLWEAARSGSGQKVLVSGEAGIGKSRLVREFCESSASEDRTVLRFQCSAHHVNTAFYSLIQNLEASAGIRYEDAQGQRRIRLGGLLGRRIATTREDIELVAQITSIADGDGGDVATAPAGITRGRAISVLVDRAIRMSHDRPVMVVVEDIHWIDPSSKELLERLVARAAGHPMMVIATTRLGGQSIVGSEAVTKIVLGSIGDEDSASIVRMIDRHDVLGPTEISRIVARVDGIPLFAEELTTNAIAHGGLQATSELPDSLETLLTARMDLLKDAKVVAQMGSVLGREFTQYDLSVLAGPTMGAADLDACIATLVSSGLLLPSTVGGLAALRFKHALVQDVAYTGLLRPTRQQLHQRVALHVLGEAVRTREPELVAHHLTEAGLVEDALRYWKLAGTRAAEKSANEEAIAHLSAGRRLIATTTPSASRDALAFSFCVALSGPLIAQHGYTSQEVAECLAEALELSRRVGQAPEIFSLLYARWAALLAAGFMSESLAIAEEFSSLAEQQGDPDALLARHRMIGASSMCLGQLTRAERELDALIEAYRPDQHARLAAVYGVDLRVAARCFRSEVLWLTGRTHQARAVAAEALAEATTANHSNSIAMALHFCGLVAFLNRSRSETCEYAQQMTELASRRTVGVWPTLIGGMTGWVLADQGDVDRGLTLLVDGVNKAARAGVAMFLPFVYCRIAEILILVDRLPEADRYLVLTEELMDRTGEIIYRGELLRLQAELLLRQGDSAAARARLTDALDAARLIGCGSVELRIATTYARLLEADGTPGHGFAVAPVADRFSARPRFAGVGDAHDALALCGDEADGIPPAD